MSEGADALSAASPVAFVPEHRFLVLPASFVELNVRSAVAERALRLSRSGGIVGSTRGNERSRVRVGNRAANTGATSFGTHHSRGPACSFRDHRAILSPSNRSKSRA